MAASRINILAVSSQIAGTVRTKLMSLILNESSMKPLHIVFKRWSFRYRMLWVKTSIASNSRPFSSLHLVSLWTLWNIEILKTMIQAKRYFNFTLPYGMTIQYNSNNMNIWKQEFCNLFFLIPYPYLKPCVNWLVYTKFNLSSFFHILSLCLRLTTFMSIF